MTTDTRELPRQGAAHETFDLPPPKLRRELRTLAGATQEDVAAECGVTDGAVSYWERRGPGRRHKRRYLLLLIRWADEARSMGLPIVWPAALPGTDQPK